MDLLDLMERKAMDTQPDDERAYIDAVDDPSDPDPGAAPMDSTSDEAERHTERVRAWQERKAARIDRYRDRAESARSEAAARFNSHNIETLRGMAGEPIKIGHHSEKRHRKLIERADTDMRKGSEALSAAKHYERRADAAERNDSIDSRDPEAVELLGEKLAKLEALQARMKAVNDAHKRYLKKPESLDSALTFLDRQGYDVAHCDAHGYTIRREIIAAITNTTGDRP